MILSKKIYNILDGSKLVGTFNIDNNDIYVELLDNLDLYNVPIQFWNDYKANKRIIRGEHVQDFICDRVVPASRQNINHILERVGIEEYDPLKIFLYTKGVFCTDEFHLEEII